MVSYTNSGLMRWALNWAAICSSFKVKHLVIAFDRDAAAALQLNGILVHDASAAAAALPSSTRFRETPELFRLMMMPGGWTSAWNTGIVVARNTPAAAAALQEWANRLDPAALSKTAEGWQIDDQLGFSNMIDEGSLPWTKHFAANFVTYENLVTEYVARVARVWQQHTGKPMALLHQHLLAAAFQLQVLAEALAAARVLGRVLVPPRFICYCWQDSSAYTDMLSTCEMQGENTCVLQ
ncbi:hypothetical protein OEZ86_002651 [Tetradesmus obliquus]|nr:hypothetical protein OEZ86_002651 [Tetradesmus obliquus]